MTARVLGQDSPARDFDAHQFSDNTGHTHQKGNSVTSRLRKVREEHRAQVLRRLRSDGPLSRAVLARDLGLSAQSISEIMAELQVDGHVASIGAASSSGGRRPILYELRHDSLRAVGVHVGTGQVSAVITDLSGQIYAESVTECHWARDRAGFVAALQKVVKNLTIEDSAPLAGIGLGVPATMHRSEEGVVRPAGASDWDDGVDLLAVLEQFELPVIAENRAHAVAVGEHLFGAAQDNDELICLMLDRGLGGAVITGGRLFTGGDGGAGALGRMVLNIGADPIRVADLVSAEAITGSALKRLRAAGREELAGVRLEDLDLDAVVDHAMSGDREMAEVMAEVGRCLGAVTAATLCVTDSQLVLLCGSVMRAGALIVDPLVKELTSRWPFEMPEVKVGRLGQRAVVLGAAALVLTDKLGPATKPMVH